MSSQILALRPISKGVKSKNLQDIITLTDFKKVFSTIHREKLIKILAANGIPKRLVRAIEVTYTDTKAKIVLDYTLTKTLNEKEEELVSEICQNSNFINEVYCSTMGIPMNLVVHKFFQFFYLVFNL